MKPDLTLPPSRLVESCRDKAAAALRTDLFNLEAHQQEIRLA
jgi:hypothetical protein